MPGKEFDEVLLALVQQVVSAGDMLLTLRQSKPNWITAIGDDGILVETEHSRARDNEPQLVPAWMVTIAWDHLSNTGHLSRKHLHEELGVRRSAFVCALLTRFPGVSIESTGPIALRYDSTPIE
jgi:hypothetical protein